MKLELANRSILNLLEIAAAKGEYIDVQLKNRKLGKTKALIQFAKENDYTVLVGSVTEAKFLIKEYGYRSIKSVNSYTLEGFSFFVFDESVTKKQVDTLRKNGKIVLTGFARIEGFYDS